LPEGDLARQRDVVEAFLTAARAGDFNALLAVLDPDVVLRADAAAVALGSKPEVRGAELVANAYKGRAQMARAVLLDGAMGVVVVPAGKLLLALLPEIKDGRIASIEIVADPEKLRQLEFGVL
jgi:RNA polymerase sigma-70 factor (ECF subfamily)